MEFNVGGDEREQTMDTDITDGSGVDVNMDGPQEVIQSYCLQTMAYTKSKLFK